MSVKYDLYQNPPSAQHAEGYHVRLKNSGTLTTDHLAKRIEHATSLTASDVKSVLIALSRFMRDGLAEGQRIHIEGVGYFSLTASAPVVDHPKAMRAEYVRVKGVAYQPEKELLTGLEGRVHFERSPFKVHSGKWTLDEIKVELERYFSDHAFITRAVFGTLFGLTRTTAVDRLNRLVAEGFLRKEGAANAPVYTPTS